MKSKAIKPPWGAWYHKEKGVQFYYWFPSTQQCSILWKRQDKEYSLPLKKEENGVYSGFIKEMKPGDRYLIEAKGIGRVADPYSLFQPDGVHGDSQIIDPALFYTDRFPWQGQSMEEALIYELHIGAFTPGGTFKDLIPYLAYLRALGINTIELMPITAFPGDRNWGYDSVFKYAPAACYGTPQDLVQLIDAIHHAGLSVILDVIYNHFGPDGNYLYPLSRDFFSSDYITPWGDAIDFRKREVRNYFIGSAKHWIYNYGFDGLRMDAIHAIWDPTEKHIVVELCEEVKNAKQEDRSLMLILENFHNQASFLGDDKADGTWNDDFHHAIHVALTKEIDGYYVDFQNYLEEFELILKNGFAYGERVSKFLEGKVRGESGVNTPPYRFVNFVQNHDQIGNRAFGERLISLAGWEAVSFAIALTILCPGTPMLFMGEELFIDAPFLYFTDHNEDLGKKVIEGRREEFSQFSAFSNEALQKKIPSPQSLETYLSSKIPWNQLNEKSILERTMMVKTCFNLRKEYKEDYALKSKPSVHRQGSLFDVKFGKVRLQFNLSSAEVEIDKPIFEPGIFEIKGPFKDKTRIPSFALSFGGGGL